MGCCFSTSHDPHRPGPEPTPPPPPHHHPPSTSPSSSSRYHHHHQHRSANTNNPTVPLSQPFNAPIRPHTWHSKRRRWTRTLLDQERAEFFETRVTGRPEVWAALSAALTFLRAGDIATAQSIVDAAGVTVPTGDLCQGCYDEQGVLYRLPRCIVSDPVNIVVGDDTDAESDGDGGESDTDGEGLEVDDDDDDDDTKFALDSGSGDELIGDADGEVKRARRRDEKGKTSERDLIRVKARLSDRDGMDVVLAVGKAQNVGLIARRVQLEAGIPRTHRVRIAYLGRILKENTPLIEQGWKQGHAVNAFVVPRHLSH